jgi:hypothetical protein
MTDEGCSNLNQFVALLGNMVQLQVIMWQCARDTVNHKLCNKMVHQGKKETCDMVKLWIPGAGSTQTRPAGFQ